MANPRPIGNINRQALFNSSQPNKQHHLHQTHQDLAQHRH